MKSKRTNQWKHRALATLLGCWGSFFFSLSNADEEKVLNIYNWSDYIAEDTVTNFEKESGIKVRYATFDSSEILHAKLVAGRSGYDVVMSSTGWARMQADGGLLLPLDKSQLPNLKNLDPVLTKKIAELDPGNRYMVNWLWGYTTVGINVDKVKAALGGMPMPDNAWDLIFKPEYASKLKSCGVSFLDSASEVLPAALLYMGRNPGSKNQVDYAAATDMLSKIRPYVTLFSSSGYLNDVINGSVCVAMGWSGDLGRATRRAKELGTGQTIQAFLPKTGAVLFFDTMVIPADAPHPGNAHKFMNYIMRPEVHASLTNKLSYANPNIEARKFVKPEILGNPLVFPGANEMSRLVVQEAVNNETRRLASRTFTRFKTGL